MTYRSALPALAGLSGSSYSNTDVFAHGFRICVVIAAALLVVGSALAVSFISNDVLDADVDHHAGCAISGPPLGASRQTVEPVRRE